MITTLLLEKSCADVIVIFGPPVEPEIDVPIPAKLINVVAASPFATYPFEGTHQSTTMYPSVFSLKRFLPAGIVSNNFFPSGIVPLVNPASIIPFSPPRNYVLGGFKFRGLGTNATGYTSGIGLVAFKASVPSTNTPNQNGLMFYCGNGAFVLQVFYYAYNDAKLFWYRCMMDNNWQEWKQY